MGATLDQQVSLTLALAYLSYYVANSPAKCSGAIQASSPCKNLHFPHTCKTIPDIEAVFQLLPSICLPFLATS